MKKGYKVLDKVAMPVVAVGGLNWGSIGFFQYNFVDALFGKWSWLPRVIYGVVGVATIWLIKKSFK